ncbi:MAG: hypothetical protein ABTS16_16350 [Candidatus Accumulibacter phosphatis]|jgi:hypothetical protein|uniref:hypothetical protein n=1 Tax=Candidatus Accumulibacter contiguus TaxID=2954381 RepID=UPI002FC344BE
MRARAQILHGSVLKPGRVRPAIANTPIPVATVPGLHKGTREDAGSAMSNAMGR